MMFEELKEWTLLQLAQEHYYAANENQELFEGICKELERRQERTRQMEEWLKSLKVPPA